MKYQHIYGWILYSSVFIKKRAQALGHIFSPTVFENMPLPTPHPLYHLWTSTGFVINLIMTVVCPSLSLILPMLYQSCN
jgi:hypothetical protein